MGFRGGTSVGESLFRAAQKENFEARFLDSNAAYGTNALVRRIYWHVFDRLPYDLRAFSRQVLDTALETRADVVMATGIVPVDFETLDKLRVAGIKSVNFLTDDPWNPAHRSRWFLRALPMYDVVFTPRRANTRDLLRAECKNVHYLPFGYDPDIFYPDIPSDAIGSDNPQSDVYFAGGADHDRVSYIRALIDAGFDIHLHGGYWDRYPETRKCGRGHADPASVRRGLSSTKIGLCLVRRANRDGNCMRTFEVPAAGACLLAEDTEEHREIFGPDGDAAVFFTGPEEMVEKARYLLTNDAQRRRIAEAGHSLITRGQNKYRDRLIQMCDVMRSD